MVYQYGRLHKTSNFRLGNQQFGVDINLVQSIEREINIVRVPNAMKYISGIVNLRGEVIPAFSLRKSLAQMTMLV